LTSYQYDAKDQLTQEQSPRGLGYTHSFGYDAAGNPTTFKGTAQSFNSNNQQTGAGFSHDANGNPTTYKGTTLTFDPENRLTTYGTTLTVGYRGDGLRAWKESNGTRTYFLYDGSLPIFETDLSDNGERVNTFGAAGLVSRHEQSCLDCDGSAFYTFDPQGNVSQSLNGRAAPTSSEAYDAHGAAIVGSGGPWGYGAQWGYYTDEETGLQLLTHRYYDPQAGRFLTRDPIGYLGGVNLYEHVRNNPVGFDDPSGLDGISHARPRIMPPDPGDVGPKYIGDPPSKQGTIDPPPIRPTPPTPPTVSGPPSGGGGCGCETAVPRWPDFYTFGGSVPLPDLPFIGGSLHVTIDRNWNMYVSPGVAVGYPSAGGGSATAGWLNQWCKPTPSQLEGLLTGPAIGVSGASPWGLAGGFSWSPGNGSATQIGLGGPIGGGVSGGWGFRFR
jgi:RHS repeat-associated protein